VQPIAAAREAVRRVETRFAELAAMRKRARCALVKHTREDNIRFDEIPNPVHDASSWVSR